MTIKLAREVEASAVFLSADVSGYAQTREAELGRACAGERIELHACPGITVVPPGDVAPADGDHFRVFTPYWRRWREAPRRSVLEPPRRVVMPDGPTAGPGERAATGGDGVTRLPRAVSPRPASGTSRRRERKGLAAYEERHDDLPGDATSRLSPFLRFGCLAARARREAERPGQGGTFPSPALLARLLPPAARRESPHYPGGLPDAARHVAGRP